MPIRPLHLTLVTALSSTAVMAQSTYAVINSPQHGFFGEGVAIIGDVDRDGFDDYVVTTRIEHHVFSGRTGVEIMRVVGVAGNDNRSVAAAGDVDNDGWPDLIVGKEGSFSAPTEGVATVLSGADGHRIWEWRGSVPGEAYAAFVSGVGDVDADGYADVAVAAAQWGTSLPRYVDVCSGRTGMLLRRLQGGVVGGHVGDVDGDGRDDVIVTAQNMIVVYSVLSGAAIVTASGTFSASPVTGVGDIDGDGIIDLAMGHGSASQPGLSFIGAVRVFSGANGAEIRTLWGISARQLYGFAIAAVGDLNGDGYRELVVSDANVVGSSRRVDIIDLRNQVVLWSRTGPRADTYGAWVGAGGDVNGDGVPDVMISAPQPGVPAPSGYVEIISGATLSLLTSTPFVPISTGGTQALSLDAGSAFAGSQYLVLGSATGIGPGLQFAGISIPLNLDGYMLFTLQFPNTAPLASSFSRLDAFGRGRAFFSIPAGVLPAALVGLTVDHAFVLASSAGALTFASNAMPVTLVN